MGVKTNSLSKFCSIKKFILLGTLYLPGFISFCQITSNSPYDSLAASDTLNWPQMQYLDSLVKNGAWGMSKGLFSEGHREQLAELGIIQQIQETVQQVPEHIVKLDSLLQEKSDLIQEKILSISSNAQKKVDSIGQAVPLDLKQYTSKMEGIDQLIDKYSSQLTEREELSWLQDHLGQLQQMDGALSQYQGKLLDLDELEQLKSYQQQLQQLTGQSQGYFQEAKGLLKGGLKEESPLMQKLQSLLGNRKEFQELQAKTAELEQFKQLSQKYGENYARQHREEAQQRLMDKAREIGAGVFAEHQDKVKEVQDKIQKLKKKYSSVADARDLSTAVKRNSLKGEPLAKHLVLGGSFQITPAFSRKDSAQGIPNQYAASVDLSPIIGYRLNKKFTMGVSFTYRAQLIIDELQTQNQTYGWRSYLEYYPRESIFLHGEYQAMSREVNQGTATEQATRQWVSGALVGIGKEYGLFKGIKGQVLLLYDFLHDKGQSPYKKPLVIRFGFTI